MHIYEYLFTAIIIVLILLSSSTMIETISEPSRSTSEKEQLKVTAQKLMTQLLLDPGNPPDWGNNIDIDPSNLTTFGLAKYSETTREAYVLDADKVLRLDNTNPLFLPPSSVINLLNLGYEYGFALEFYPALNVTIAPINSTSSSDRYNINVTEYNELPIVMADVTARMYYYNSSSQTIATTGAIFNQTGADGKCIVDFGNVTTEMKILSLVINYYGIRIVKSFTVGSNVTQVHLIGNHALLNQPYNLSSSATEIIVTKKDGVYTIESVKSNLNKINATIFELAYVEPSTVAILTVSEDGTKLILASKEATLTYSSIQGVSLSFPFAYSIERSVTIGGSAYIVRLYLWRMSW